MTINPLSGASGSLSRVIDSVLAPGLPVTIETVPENSGAEKSAAVIFVSGFPSKRDLGQNRAASARIIEERLASTIRYSSSRNWELWEKATYFDDQLLAFAGKNYHDELRELQQVIDYTNQTLQPRELYLSGTSYGGGLVTLIAPTVPKVRGILLSCPQIDPEWRKERGWPCYGDFPERIEFTAAISRFQGRVWILHSVQDQVVSIAQGKALHDAVKTKDKKFIELDGAEHVFVGQAREAYVQVHQEFFNYTHS